MLILTLDYLNQFSDFFFVKTQSYQGFQRPSLRNKIYLFSHWNTEHVLIYERSEVCPNDNGTDIRTRGCHFATLVHASKPKGLSHTTQLVMLARHGFAFHYPFATTKQTLNHLSTYKLEK